MQSTGILPATTPPMSPGTLRRGVTALARTARAVPGWTARAIGSGWHLAAQLGGGGAALTGLYMLAGTAATLVVGGLALLTVGTLAEMGNQPRKGR